MRITENNHIFHKRRCDCVKYKITCVLYTFFKKETKVMFFLYIMFNNMICIKKQGERFDKLTSIR